MKKIALVPGSFDPPTIGHYDLAVRASRIFDEVLVVAFVNGAKNGRFGSEERLELLKASFLGIENIKADICSGLLADYAKEHNVTAIVKGARGAVDFDYELGMSIINRSLDEELDTVIFPTKAEYLHVSSTMVSEMIKYGRNYSKLVPPNTAELIKKYTSH